MKELDILLSQTFPPATDVPLTDVPPAPSRSINPSPLPYLFLLSLLLRTVNFLMEFIEDLNAFVYFLQYSVDLSWGFGLRVFGGEGG